MSLRSLVKKFLANRSSRSHRALLDQLESRMLLSVSIATNGKSATWTDVDGDTVTMAITKGTLIGGNFTTANQGLGEQLQKLDLSGGGFDNSNLTFTVKRAATGDGAVNVGYINSLGHDLATVSLPGDLGQIDAGDATLTTPGVKSLTVRSMGQVGLDSQGGAGGLGGDASLSSDINQLATFTVNANIVGASINVTGDIGNVKIAGSFIGAFIEASNGDIGTVKITGDIIGDGGTSDTGIFADGSLASLTVGGSIIGGSTSNTARISCDGGLGAIKITGDFRGGDGTRSATLDTNGKITSITIGGSFIGGAGLNSGAISCDLDMGTVNISGDIRGGAAANSGYLFSDSNIASLNVGGSVIGGGGTDSGEVNASLDMGNVKISGNLIGGSGIDRTGYIFANHNMGNVTIGGSIIGGSGDDSGLVCPVDNIGNVTVNGSIIGGSGASSGQVVNAGNIGTVKIGRDIVGGTGDSSGSVDTLGKIPSITVGGSVFGGGSSTGYIAADNLAKVSITGNLVGASISGTDSVDTAGYLKGYTRIGSITIGGSIIAGVDNSAGTITRSGAILSTNDIDSITVKGSIIGNATNPVVIQARGQVAPTATKDLAIGTIAITGRMEYAAVYAGFNFQLVEANGDAQINTIKVGTDFIASFVRAGTTLGADTLVATNDDGIIPGGGTPVSTISSIQIGGQVFGTPADINNTDHFGFSAQKIAAVKIAGKALSLNAADDTDNIDIGATGDVAILEP